MTGVESRVGGREMVTKLGTEEKSKRGKESGGELDFVLFSPCCKT